MAAMKRTDTTAILEVLEQIRADLSSLAGRVAKLEGQPAAPAPAIATAEAESPSPPAGRGAKLEGRPAAPAPAIARAEAESPSPGPPAEAISEEILAAISAAVGAFFGERVHIRQIRVLSSPAWAQQGRVSIQAS